MFVEKCKLHEIPEELVQILLDISVKTRRQNIKESLSQLIEKKSSTIFRFHIPADLIRTALDLFLLPMNSQRNKESLNILVTELSTHILDLCLKQIYKNLDESVGNLSTKTILKSALKFLDSLSQMDKSQIFKSLKDLVLALNLTDTKNLSIFINLIEILDLLFNEKAEYKYKMALVQILETVKLPEDIASIIILMLMCGKDDNVIYFKGQKIRNFQQVSALFRKIIDYLIRNFLGRPNKILLKALEKVMTSIYFVAKGIK